MSILASSSLLQTALLADAVVSGATGLLLAFGADPLALWLGLPAALLVPVSACCRSRRCWYCSPGADLPRGRWCGR